MQFVDQKVQGDFLSGMFNVTPNTQQKLEELEQVRRIVIMPWRGSSSVALHMQVDSTIKHVTALLEKSEDIFQLSSAATPWSYERWVAYLEQLSTTLYWEMAVLSNPKGEIPREIVTPKDPDDLDPHRTSRSDNSRGARPKITIKSCCSPTHSVATHSIDKSDRSRRSAGPVELICIDSSSGSETDTSSTTSDDSFPRQRRRRSRSRRRTKEVVKPLPFEMNGWRTLKQFFASYERYFSGKFDGSSRDCTQELRPFLPDEMVAFYDSLGGPRLKYSKMKEELTLWYKTHKRSGTEYWRSHLRKMKLEPGMSLKVFGLKLKDVSVKAYPHDQRECARELRKQFLRSVPREFAKHILRSEEIMDVKGARGKLTFADLLKLADKEDERTSKKSLISDDEVELAHEPKRIWYSREVTEAAASDPKSSDTSDVQTFPPRTFKSQQRNPNQRSPRRKRWAESKNASPVKPPTKQTCPWCGRTGHGMDNCWLKLGFCTICGNNQHVREDCPKFKPLSPQRSSRCPSCSGPHLGKDCPLNQ